MEFSKYALGLSFLLTSVMMFDISAENALPNQNEYQTKVYGSKSKTTATNNNAQADEVPNNQPQQISTRAIVSKQPIDGSNRQVDETRKEVKPSANAVFVKSNRSEPVVSTSNTSLSEGYKATIVFKDGARLNGTVLSSSTNSIYDVILVGSNEVVKYNAYDILRIESKDNKTIEILPENQDNKPINTTVSTSEGYKATIYFKDGSKMDGTVLPSSTNSVYDIQLAGRSDVIQYKSNTILRIEAKNSSTVIEPSKMQKASQNSISNIQKIKKEEALSASEGYKASIYFKDGSKMDGTVLPTSTNIIYDVMIVGVNEMQKYNSNSIHRIVPKDGTSVISTSHLQPTIIPTITQTKRSNVVDWQPYKASIYFKDGAIVNGTVIAEGVEFVKIRKGEGTVMDAKSEEIARMTRR